jgi:hypothetical protein
MTTSIISMAYELIDINDRMPRAEAEEIFLKIKSVGELFILGHLVLVMIFSTSAQS